MIISYSDAPVSKGHKSIFLAGPTPRDKETVSWRKAAIEILQKSDFQGIVYVPEFSDNTPKQSYIDQADWELEALENSTIIVFWLPRDLEKLPGFTTNTEFGYWLHSKKVIYGRPDNAPKTKYQDYLYRRDYQKEPYNNLEELLNEAIKMVDNR